MAPIPEEDSVSYRNPDLPADERPTCATCDAQGCALCDGARSGRHRTGPAVLLYCASRRGHIPKFLW
ncbi:hypothetical protein [Nocardia macrotermitis]|uniref:Uncharacterized protein n=1 Tax=Nocardia macrotermitis TaxID=2585198 RepID=A0A7K0DD45_9NOCA|nr:hypothetical protein [Nocardia macrotermitis]MQY23539.1 hypothetical protein [Nocardia macrotermitis]